MAVVLVEGFDGGLGDYNLRENVLASGSLVTGRTGANGFQPAANDTGYKYNFPVALESSTIDVAFALRYNTGGQPVGVPAFLNLRSDSGSTTHLAFYQTGSGHILAYRGATVLFTSDPGVLDVSGSGWAHVEIEATLHDSTGTLRIWVDGALICDETGLDTKNGGTKTVWDQVNFHYQAGYWAPIIDDLVIANSVGPLGDCTVHLLLPSGNGASSDLLGSDADSTDNYALVDEATPSMSDYVGGETADDHDTYAFSNLSVSSGVVVAVEARAYALKSDSGNKALRLAHREDAINSYGVDKTLGTDAATFAQIWEENPASAAPWTIAEVNDSEFGVAVRDLA